MTSSRIDQAGISARYGVVPRDADVWTQLVNFPAADDHGLRDVARVDAWVQAMRPQYWPPKPEADASSAPGSPAAKPEKAAAAEPAEAPAPVTETRAEMAKRFRVSHNTASLWTKTKARQDPEGKVLAKAFPAPVSDRRWDTKAVDTWVRSYRRRVWTAYSGSEPQFVKPLPEGHPQDLLDIGEYGVIRGNALSGKPALRGTMQTYLLRNQIAKPDRLPKDRKRPEVFEPMWFRETINREIRRRLTRGTSEADAIPPKE
ncbi:hypothetical protein ACIREO_23520 [Streptomyces sp. NPDC102441]|uniref:hypothetical protein n=1 Tax=Streptomyces sp. NPDC102441 TaxID=3366176 RepID=UPI0037FB097B